MLFSSLKLLRKPMLWQRSQAPFWDDEHISKMMLEAHLDPDVDAASRRLETIERSASWLSTVIPPGGKVLDLGCGPGLYTGRLSERGYRVTGMDLSRRSLEYARAHDGRTEYIRRNYLELDYSDAFDAVLLIYCDYAALTKPERQSLLTKVLRALKPGGLFLFDVFTAKHWAGKVSGTSWTVQENGGFWCAEPHLCLNAVYFYEENTVAADQCFVVSDTGIKEYLLWDTVYTREMLLEELASAGFRVKDVRGDICGRPYTGETETLCAIAEK